MSARSIHPVAEMPLQEHGNNRYNVGSSVEYSKLMKDCTLSFSDGNCLYYASTDAIQSGHALFLQEKISYISRAGLAMPPLQPTQCDYFTIQWTTNISVVTLFFLPLFASSSIVPSRFLLSLSLSLSDCSNPDGSPCSHLAHKICVELICVQSGGLPDEQRCVYMSGEQCLDKEI